MKKKGFTLIELMIVLAVIAILAVVLIPKAGQAKNNAKNAGVTTNINAVRGMLEQKTGTNFLDTTDEVKTALASSFNSTTADADVNVVNPFSQKNTVTSDSSVAQPAVYVVSAEPAATALANLKGSVVVVVVTDSSYTIFGVDNGGTKINEVKVSK